MFLPGIGKIHRVWCLAIQRLMATFRVIELEILGKAHSESCRGFIRSQVHVLILYAPPEPFDEHIIDPPAFAIHTDRHAVGVEHGRECLTGVLRSLIRVEDLRGSLAPQGSGTRKFRFKHKLVSLDSTVIDLCLSPYDWPKFRRTKGAVKLHLVLDHDGYLPAFGVITDGKVQDVTVAHQLVFAPGTIVVDDRGYNDYQLAVAPTSWTENSGC